MTNEEKQLSEKELKHEATALGQRLTLLILSLPVTEEQKEKLLERASKMSLEEAATTYRLLEGAYLDQKTKELDNLYQQQLASLVAGGEEKLAALDLETAGKISKLTVKQ